MLAKGQNVKKINVSFELAIALYFYQLSPAAMPILPLVRKSVLLASSRIAASNATTTAAAGRRGIGWLLASPPKPGTPRYVGRVSGDVFNVSSQ